MAQEKKSATNFKKNSTQSADHILSFDGEYDDVIGVINTGTGNTAWNFKALRDTGMLFGFLRNNSGDFFSFNAQMPHSKEPQSAIGDFHVHGIFDTAITAGQTVVFNVWYYVHKNGTNIPAIGSWSTATLSWVADANYSQWDGKIIDLATNITMPANVGYGGMLYVKVERGNGTWTGEFGISSADAHVLKSQIGSINRISDI